MKKTSAWLRWLVSNLCVLLFVIVYLQLSDAMAEEARGTLHPAAKVVPTLPPGFFAADLIQDPDLWDPGLPGQCNVVYSAS